MKTKDTEQEILQKALEGLQKTANLNVQIQYGNYDFDAILRIGLHEMKWDFAAEIKSGVTPATLGVIAQRLRKLPQKGLLVTRYVAPQMADRMKEMDIQFIVAAGNAYLNAPPLLIFAKGNRPVEKHPTERSLSPLPRSSNLRSGTLYRGRNPRCPHRLPSPHIAP